MKVTTLTAAFAGVALSALALPALAQNQPVLAPGPLVVQDGLSFADLDRDSSLSPYEDWRLPAEARAADLVSRMTLEERAGALVHATAPTVGQPATGYDLDRAKALIQGKGINSLITRFSGAADQQAEANNALQALARDGRLGIPLTISSDPRNHFQFTLGASVLPGAFSKWPEALGLAAIGDVDLVRTFGDIARQEYRAVGIQMALSPQADLPTEPRWPRQNGTFGDDPELAHDLIQSYVEGFQHGTEGLTTNSVITIVKHWVGYSAAVDGWDGHNYYGRYVRIAEHEFDAHVRPFEGAFAAHAAGVMPSYTIIQDLTLSGRPLEGVGGGYSVELLQTQLRQRFGFTGMILSDWGVTADCREACLTGVPDQQSADISTAWGVLDLTVTQRFAKGLNAGLDQFGGTEASENLVDAVREGLVTEARLNESVVRVIMPKFALGLFENPFVDPARAATVVGSPTFVAQADAAQRRALVPLKRTAEAPELRAGDTVFLYGVDPAAAESAGLLVTTDPTKAKAAIFRMTTPFENSHPGYFFGKRQHEGSLAFSEDNPDLVALRAAAAHVPVLATLYLDRPAIVTPVLPLTAMLLGNFGVSDAALIDVLMGRAQAEGRLPFALPRDMDSVIAQSPGAPNDIADPLFRRGYGFNPGRAPAGSPGQP